MKVRTKRGHETERGELVTSRQRRNHQDCDEEDSGNFKDDHEIAPVASYGGGLTHVATTWEKKKREDRSLS
jgi:hypothetical protein